MCFFGCVTKDSRVRVSVSLEYSIEMLDSSERLSFRSLFPDARAGNCFAARRSPHYYDGQIRHQSSGQLQVLLLAHLNEEIQVSISGPDLSRVAFPLGEPVVHKAGALKSLRYPLRSQVPTVV